jgi:hypothetical protein
MNIKQLILVCAILSLNTLCLPKTTEKEEELFTNPERVELDKLNSAQKQLDHLTTEAPFWTGTTKGVALFTLGGLIVVGAQLYNPNLSTDQKGVVGSVGGIFMAGGTTYTVLSATNNFLEKEYYQRMIYGIQKKRAD